MVRLTANIVGALICAAFFQALADTKLEGVAEEGGLLFGLTTPGARVIHDGQVVRVSPGGDFLIGFHRDAKVTSELVIQYPDGRVEKRNLKIKDRQYAIERINGLPASKVTPDKRALERIREEAKLAKQARRRNDSRTDFLKGFDWPLTGRISGVYGSQRILNGQPRRPHFGVDIAAPTGTPVAAPSDGVVTFAHPDMYFSGKTLFIDHGHGLSSAFLHLHKVLVKVGQRVRRGQIVAQVGATGRVTGPHLDWRMNLFEKRVDPTRLVGPMPAH